MAYSANWGQTSNTSGRYYSLGVAIPNAYVPWDRRPLMCISRLRLQSLPIISRLPHRNIGLIIMDIYWSYRYATLRASSYPGSWDSISTSRKTGGFLSPGFHPIHGDPRFENLIRRIGYKVSARAWASFIVNSWSLLTINVLIVNKDQLFTDFVHLQLPLTVR